MHAMERRLYIRYAVHCTMKTLENQTETSSLRNSNGNPEFHTSLEVPGDHRFSSENKS